MYGIGCCIDDWDFFHIGHINFLEACRKKCNYLIVGILTDENTEFSDTKRAEDIEKTKLVDKIFVLDDVYKFFEKNKIDCYFYDQYELDRELLQKYNLKTQRVPMSPYISTDIVRQMRREIVQIVVSNDDDIIPMGIMAEAFKCYYFYIKMCYKQPNTIVFDDSILFTYASEMSVFTKFKDFKNRQHPLIVNNHKLDIFKKIPEIKVDYVCVPTDAWREINNWDDKNKIITLGNPMFDLHYDMIQSKPDKKELLIKYNLDPEKTTIVYNLQFELDIHEYNTISVDDQQNLPEVFYLADIFVTNADDLVNQFICYDKPMIVMTDKVCDFCLTTDLKSLEKNINACLRKDEYREKRKKYFSQFLGKLDGTVCLRTVYEIIKKTQTKENREVTENEIENTVVENAMIEKSNSI